MVKLVETLLSLLAIFETSKFVILLIVSFIVIGVVVIPVMCPVLSLVTPVTALNVKLDPSF